MGGSISLNKINFEDMKSIISNENDIIISTLPVERQDCLILGTLSASSEVAILNETLSKGNSYDTRIVIYGENSSDDTIVTKYKQLIQLGFIDIYVYLGGLFEWVLLQDIYGFELFPTTSVENDILKFKGQKKLSVKLLK